MCVTGRSQAVQADLLKRLTPCLHPFVQSLTAPQIVMAHSVVTQVNQQNQAAASIARISICSPAAVAMFTSASRPIKLILPRMRP